MLANLGKTGIQAAYVTLHVGAALFSRCALSMLQSM